MSKCVRHEMPQVNKLSNLYSFDVCWQHKIKIKNSAWHIVIYGKCWVIQMKQEEITAGCWKWKERILEMSLKG